MALTPLKDLLASAEKGGYAVGAFNVNNMEIVQGIVAAANETESPVILQASQGAIKYAGLRFVVALARIAEAEAKVPVALHLDHGTSFEQAMACIREGFSSVMFDGSHLPLEENIRWTSLVVQVAHAVGVSVEGEIGRIGGTEDDISVSEWEASLADPDEAVRFAKETGIDALAAAIGSAHGFYKGEPKLDFDRLERIHKDTGLPMVLHGGSGIPDDAIKRAIQLGVRKINVDTELRHAFVTRMREVMAERPDEIDPRKILGPAKEALQQKVKEKIVLFGSAGRA